MSGGSNAGGGVEVTLHFAQSLDGRIARENERTRLSSKEGLARAQRIRAESDAVIVGVRTIEIDDPRLTLRDAPGPEPRRVVLSSTLRIPPASRLLKETSSEIIVVGAAGRADEAERARLEERGVRVIVVDAEQGWVSVAHALAELSSLGVRRALVEGGGRVLSSFLRSGLVSHVSIETAPVFLGSPGTPAFDLLAGKSARLTHVRADEVDGHVFLRGDVVYA